MGFLLNSYFAPLGSGFILQIDTTKSGSTLSNQFNLALRPNTFYHFYVDWGDGSPLEEYNFSNTTGVTHTYPSDGVYTISIGERSIGGFPSLRYNNTGDDLKVLNIKQFGTNQFGTTWASAFDGCANLNIDATDFSTAKTKNIVNLVRAFAGCSSLSSFPLIDTSNVESFQQAWRECVSLSAFPLLDTSKGKSFNSTWLSAVNLKNFPEINTSNSINFANTWRDCYSLNSFPLLDTSKGTSFDSAWRYCRSLSAFQQIDTSQGQFFGGAWQDCVSLSSFPSIDTSNATTLLLTWAGCTALTGFPLINTSNVTNFQQTWENCRYLSASDFPTLDMSKMTNGINCFNLVRLTTSSYSSLLTSLCSTNFNTGVQFHGGNSKRNLQGTESYNYLTSNRGWSINDGGPE